MACSHPLKGFYIYGQNPLYKDLTDIKVDKYSREDHKKANNPFDLENVKIRSNKKVVVKPYDVNHLELINNRLVSKYDEEVSFDAKAVYTEFVEIPCGKCIGCRLKRSREWANRCMLELPYHEQSWFVTLTYNNEHVPSVTDFDDYGNYVERFTLKKKDLQDFFKRLRKNYKYDNHIKYYACGEYGENPQATHRPHYHCIIFGLKLDDLKLYKQSRLGFNYYTSAFLDRCWSHYNAYTKQIDKIGHVIVAEVTWETCAYTARYIMKKLIGKEACVYDELSIEPEFNSMSLKPAIAYDYFKENKNRIYELDSITVSTTKGGLTTKPPKYFDSKMSENIEDALLLNEIRTVRQEVASLNKKHKLEQTDLDYLDILKIEEDLLNTRLSSLKRKEI